jgi:hypothetical protein
MVPVIDAYMFCAGSDAEGRSNRQTKIVKHAQILNMATSSQ